jgi:hypothetical protein
MAEQGGWLGLDANLLCQSGSRLSSCDEADSLERTHQADGFTRRGFDQFGKPFGENLSRAGTGGADEFPNGQVEDDMASATRNVSHGSQIPAMHAFGALLAKRASGNEILASKMNFQALSGGRDICNDEVFRETPTGSEDS